MAERSVPPRLFHLLGILPVVGLILSIVGGTKLETSNPDSDTVHDAAQFSQIGSILFLVTFILCAVVVALTGLKFRYLLRSDIGLYLAASLSIPFLLVRIIYVMLVSYNIEDSSSAFNSTTGNIFIQAFMSTFEEFVVVIMYLAAGIMTPAVSRDRVRPGQWEQGKEAAHQGIPTRGYELRGQPTQCQAV